MGDSITWQLNANASHISTVMRQAMQDVNTGTGAIVNGFNRADLAHGNLLKSNARVAARIGRFTQELTSGADATQVFAGALEGLERSLKLPLGSLAGLAILATVVVWMDKANDAAINLSKSCRDLSNTGLDELNKKAEEVTDLNRPGFGKFVRMLTGAQQLVDQAGENVEHAKDMARGRISRGLRQSGYVTELENRGDTSGAKRQKLADEEKAERDSLIGKADKDILYALDQKYEALRRNLDIEIREAETEERLLATTKARAAEDKIRERTHLSLAELADVPDVVSSSVSYERWKASQDAKKVMDLEAQGEPARQNFDPDKARALFKQADDLRNSISDLKPSEKSQEFKAALDTSERLRKIEEKLSFAGK